MAARHTESFKKGPPKTATSVPVGHEFCALSFEKTFEIAANYASSGKTKKSASFLDIFEDFIIFEKIIGFF